MDDESRLLEEGAGELLTKWFFAKLRRRRNFAKLRRKRNRDNGSRLMVKCP